MANKFLDENGLLYFWGKIVNKITGNIVNNLTSTDANKSLSAAQGKVLDEKITAINTNMGNLGGGDMMKSAYDTDSDGKVDKANDADKLGGQSPDYYAKKDDLFSGSYNDLTDKPTDFAPEKHSHILDDITDFDEVAEGFASELENAVEEMTEIANGKCASYVFETEADLTEAITEYKAYITDETTMSEDNVLNGVTLKVGDVFLIKEVKVPDYWWSGTDKAVLETTKVDITTISNTEIDTIVAS